MVTFYDIVALFIAYFIGAIPSAVWIGKRFYGIDVREFGSGNAGATNTFRVLGKKAGIPVLFIDILKGWLAVQLAYFSTYRIDSVEFVNLELVLGIAALIGHIFPVYVGFRGGKGIATLLGVVIGVHPYAALISIGVFILVLLITKYVSLSSIIASLSFPVATMVIFKTDVSSLVLFSIIVAVLVVVTHQKNIERLLRKQETKAGLFKKKQPELKEA